MGKRYIHVGSWNIEHLSKRGGRDENIYALTEHIEMASLDVLAMQEIYVTHEDRGERRNRELDGVIRLLKEHTEDDWLYQILENRSSTDDEQLCAVAWNSTVLDHLGSVKIPVEHSRDGYRLWDRTPHAIKFKFEDKTDFAVVPLHMKSNYGGASRARRVREREAATLVEKMPDVRDQLEELDIVLIGDTNCLRASEPALRIFDEAGFEDLNESDAATFVSGAPFDRVFVPYDRRVFLYSRQYIMTSANPDDHDKYLSDHYLIKTVLKIRRDDD